MRPVPADGAAAAKHPTAAIYDGDRVLGGGWID